MSDFKQRVYRGCYHHPRGHNPYCFDCVMAAMAEMVETIQSLEKRLEEVENHAEIDYSTLDVPTEPIITIKGELATLIAPIVRTNPELFINLIQTLDGEAVQDVDATPVGGDQQPEQREDPVGQRWGREITYGSGLLPDEGGTG